MDLAIEELSRSQKYHLKQLEDNLQSIRSKEEAIEILKQSNEKHKEVIKQITELIESVKQD